MSSEVKEKPAEIRMSIAAELEARFSRVRARRGGTRKGYTLALLLPALDIEELGGDAVRVLETARSQLAAAREGRTAEFGPSGGPNG